MIRRLRTAYTDAELAALYAGGYDHTRFEDHVERIAHTIALLDGLAAKTDARSVADLACGDAAIVHGSAHSWETRVLSDLSRDGVKIEDAVLVMEPVDVFVCTEIIEHVDQPARLLREIAKRARWIILSTPDGAFNDENPEHYWAWDQEAMDTLLRAGGWVDRDVTTFMPKALGSPYLFQFWTARSGVA